MSSENELWQGVVTWGAWAALVVGAACALAEGGAAASVPAEGSVTSSRPAIAATQPAGRLEPRPLLSEAEYKALADRLRKAYSRPPAEWPPPTIDPGVKYQELGLMPKEVPYPPENPFSEAKAELGQQLYFEVRLSGSRQIACASCHDAELGWADGRATSFGHERQQLKRNAPSLLNSAFATSLFWDGRAASLEDQAIAVILNPDEMHSQREEVVKRIAEAPEYRDRFEKAFGTEEVTLERISQALATFERTILTEGFTPFDRFLKGEYDRLSDSAVRGLHLFRTDARCLNCHHGPNFTDNDFHNLGLSYYGRELEDLGRYNITKNPEDVGKFRTPSLRNVARTPPYMHNGLFDLEGVLNMYNAGMPTLRRRPEWKNDPLFPTKSPLLKPLGLNKQDLADLRAFLESLSERRRRLRPGLP